MPVILIALAFLGINIVMSVFGFVILYMPYVVGFFASLILCIENPTIQALIPGHPWMSFVSVLALTEVIIRQISCAFIVFCCSVFTGAVGAMVFEGMHPDSIAYCVFVSVVYLILTVLALAINMRNLPEEEVYKTLPIRIISGVFYGLSVALIFGFLAQGVWRPFFVSSGNDTEQVEFFLNMVCVVLAGAALLITVFFPSRNQACSCSDIENS